MISLTQAAEVYEKSADVTFEAHQINHSTFREFSFRLQNFIKLLGEEIENDDWSFFVRRLKRYRFEQLAAPLGFGHEFSLSEIIWKEFNERLTRLKIFSPQLVNEASEILEVLRRLQAENENPLFETLCETAQMLAQMPIVILESRLIIPTKQIIAAHGLTEKIPVLSESQMRGGICYEQIACIGAGRWYSEHIFTAPRAEKIHLFRFDWIRDKRQTTSVFVQPVISNTARRLQVPPVKTSENYLESSDIVPTLNLNSIAASFTHQTEKSDVLADEAEARLFWLEGRRGVFLEENSRVLIIDLEEETKVRKVEVSDIAPGMFVLLRDGRGGDLIVPLANRLLGKKSARMREFQKAWKRKLRQHVQEKGLPRVLRELEDLGAIRASEINLRNWLSESSIETRDPRDFAALMKIIGMEDSLDQCSQIVKQIGQAHRKAGRQIRRLLLEMVAEADLSELEQLGEMRFEFTETGGSLVASRVVRRADSIIEIASGKINYRFSLEN